MSSITNIYCWKHFTNFKLTVSSREDKVYRNTVRRSCNILFQEILIVVH